MNAWLPKNLSLTQAKILSKNISFGLSLNFWIVRLSGTVMALFYGGHMMFEP